LYDTLDIVCGINFGGGVCSFLGDLFESGDDEGEGLGIDDVPVEMVDFDPAHCVQGAFDIVDWEAA
jgi:hypothetical protein